MKRRILISLISLLLVFCVLSSVAVSANAATGDITVTGTMQDTSATGFGKLYWSYTYNPDSTEGASLRIWGNGYMPNGTEDDWFAEQQSAGYYITKLTIEEGVKSIMSNAFAGEIKLKEVNLPSTIEFVGEGAFAYTAIETFNIPAKMRDVDANIFVGSPIKSFTVSSSNPYYKSYKGNLYTKDITELVLAAPKNYTGDKWVGFSFPSTVTSIGRYAFSNCPISSITIPSHITSIKNMAFAGCYELTNVVIENGVKEIYDSAFLACDALKYVQLPMSVDYLGVYALGYLYGYDVEGLKAMLDYKGISYGSINNQVDFEYYANLTGFGVDAFKVCFANENFILYAPVGSAGENYAKSFELNYVKSSEIVSATNSKNGVLLKWSFSPAVSYYNIYRKDGSQWEKIAYVTSDDVDQTNYVDTEALNNADNTYAIEVCYYSGYKHFDKSGVICHYVEAPELKSVTNKVGGVNVSWQSVDGATRYYIYRKQPTDTSWTRLTYISSKYINYFDKTAQSGTNYLYTVIAHDGVAASSYDRDGLGIVYVATPEFTVANNTSGVVVKWNMVDNAQSYRVYRKTSTTGWELLNEVDGSKKSFTDTTTKRGSTYIYTVRAVCDGTYSAYEKSGTTIKSLATPTVKLGNVGAGVKVSWNKCAGATGYYVYRKNSSGGWTRIATISGGSTLSYTDKSAKTGQKYTYTVKAVSGSYTSYYDYDGETIMFLKTPKISSSQSTSSGVKVKYNTVSGAKGYYIYRKTTNGNWVLVGNVKSGTTGTFTDKTAKKGATYIYTVRAYNGSTRSSYYSSGIKVKVVY